MEWTYEAIIVLIVIFGAVILFVTEWLSIDLVAMLIMISLIVSGVISPKQGIAGFSNPATITVAFMFVISYALLKTGALQRIGPLLAGVFSKNFNVGLLLMIFFVGISSAFINNTPIVAMFIPVIISIGKMSKISHSKLLIPLSYASIFGGTCTLIGTSTNVLVSGIAFESGLGEFSMFYTAPIGIVFLLVGALYLFLFGKKLLPDRSIKSDIESRFGIRDYITQIEILADSDFVGQKIMDSVIVREMELDIIEVIRGKMRFTLPSGDFEIFAGDVLKIKCNVEKISELKDRLKVGYNLSALRIGESEIQKGDTSLLELVITTGSEFEGKSLRQMDFRRRFRAVPLAIQHREEILHEHLHEVELKAGDLILIEIKTHWVETLKSLESSPKSPFVILSEAGIIDFKRKNFIVVMSIITLVIALTTFNFLPIVASTILGVCLLVLGRIITMKELYSSIEWKIVFLLAGVISLGAAMQTSGLADGLADGLINVFGQYGPLALLAALYFTTSITTELMSNNATAELLAPIAISAAIKLDVSPYPFLIAVMLAASTSLMTPIGYQTNTMVYTAGRYKFFDFFRIGAGLNLIFWLLACLLIPVFYPF
jgi:di/tricarboxylate transporter